MPDTPSSTSAPDPQSIWDAEVLADFRQRLIALASLVRDAQAAETEASEALAETRAEAKAARSRLSERIEQAQPDEDDRRYVEAVQALTEAVDRAEEWERAARQTHEQAVASRYSARHKMMAHIRTFLAPQPLCDWVARQEASARSHLGGLPVEPVPVEPAPVEPAPVEPRKPRKTARG